MEIIGINVIDSSLAVTVDTRIPETVSENLYLYIDTLDNYTKRSSDNTEDHSYSIVVVDKDKGDQVLIDTDRYVLLVNINDLPSAFITTIENSTVFYYDDEELYYKEIDLLCNHCSTCLDDQQKDRITLFVLKYDILRYAVEHNLINDAIQYYSDIARMLGINVQYTAFNDAHHTCGKCCKDQNKTICTSCCGCKNGVCSLC